MVPERAESALSRTRRLAPYSRPMPERLNRVSLDLGRREPFVISWEDREALLERLERTVGSNRVVKAIRDVGPTRPAALREQDRLGVCGARGLGRRAASEGRAPSLPRRIVRLRYLLARALAG